MPEPDLHLHLPHPLSPLLSRPCRALKPLAFAPLRQKYVALEFAGRLAPVLVALRRKDRNLEDQLRRATASVILNISEGDGKSSLRDQARFFENFASTGAKACGLSARAKWGAPVYRGRPYHCARGSCREARAALRLASVWRYLDVAEVATIDALADRVCAMLSKLVARAR